MFSAIKEKIDEAIIQPIISKGTQVTERIILNALDDPAVQRRIKDIEKKVIKNINKALGFELAAMMVILGILLMFFVPSVSFIILGIIVLVITTAASR